jgi:hypothetical protein
MLYIDPRSGSGDLLGYFKNLGVKAVHQRMEFGDVSFVGQGPDGPHAVGIEVKTIGDLVSCMVNGRYAGHQLIGLSQTYDEWWLVIEGMWRPNWESGLLECYNPPRRASKTRGKSGHKGYWYALSSGGRRWMWKEVQGFINTMMNQGGTKFWQTRDRTETARFCASQYHWWAKEYHSHQSLKTFVDYKARVGTGEVGGKVMLMVPTFERRIYKELPLIGWEKSVDVDTAFPNVLTAVNASEKDWQRIPGIGPTIAKRVYKALRREKP